MKIYQNVFTRQNFKIIKEKKDRRNDSCSCIHKVIYPLNGNCLIYVMIYESSIK